jgi:hypothetical protein
MPKEPKNRFHGIISASLCSLAGRNDNPIPTLFLSPINCSKIPAQIVVTRFKILVNFVNRTSCGKVMSHGSLGKRWGIVASPSNGL